MNIDLITDPHELARFVDGWDQLALQVAEPRAGANLITAWSRYMMGDETELRIWVATDADRVIGVLPLVAESMPRGRERIVPAMTSLMLGVIPIAQPNREHEVATALVESFASSAASADLVGIHWVPIDSPWTCAFNRVLRDSEWVALDPTPQSSFYVKLDGGIEGWSERRQRKFRNEYKRCARRLEDEGFHRVSTVEPDEILKRIPMLQDLYGGRRQARGGEGYCFDEKMLQTIGETVTAAMPGRFRLVTVERDDLTIAAQLSLRSGARESGWVMGFDPDWTRLSPGIAVFTSALDSSARAGAEVFDLGEGAESYKSRVTDDMFCIESVLWARPRIARLLKTNE